MAQLAQLIVELRCAASSALYDEKNKRGQPYGTQIFVPETSVGRVVGKAGAHFKECREVFGVHFNLVREPQVAQVAGESRSVRLLEIRAAEQATMEQALDMLIDHIYRSRIEEIRRKQAS
jgi:hypothetical protein